MIVNRSTTVRFPAPIDSEADFRDPAARWLPLFLLSEREPGRFKTPREASYYQTNHFMDEPARAAIAPIKATMARTKARPIFATDSVHLMGERHNGGEGALIMVLNAHDRLPEIPEIVAVHGLELCPLLRPIYARGHRARAAPFI